MNPRAIIERPIAVLVVSVMLLSGATWLGFALAVIVTARQ